jgi:single-strand DNA-binding protein
MAGCVNRHTIVGNLGADPEVRSLPNGSSVCNLRVATTDTWRDKQSGEQKSSTEWHSVAIFNEMLVKIAQQYLKKGSKIYICGPSKTRKWQDSNGNDRYTTEIVLQGFSGELTMLDGGSGEGAPRQNDNRNAQAQSRPNPAPTSKFAGRASHAQTPAPKEPWDLDDEIPFSR